MIVRRLQHLSESVWLRWGYWWYYAAIGSLMPFVSLYYRNLGLSGFQVGLLAATLPIGTAFFAPLWGSLADTFAAHRWVLRGVLLFASIIALLLAQASQFAVLLLLMMAIAIAVAAVPALLDGYALTISRRVGQPYGQLRVWGSVGFIATSSLIGWWMGANISNFFLFAYSGALLLGCVATFGLPTLERRQGESMWQGVSAIVRNRAVLLLLINVYIATSSASVMFGFLGIYIAEVGGSAQLVGMASAVGAISELPIFVLGARLLARLDSRRVLLFAMIVYVVRFTLHGIPLPPIGVVWVQLLHGLSYGAFLMASVTLIHELAGEARAATTQGLLTSMSLGFGSITGTLVGGALLDRIGAVGVFRVAGVGMLVACITFVLCMRAIVPHRDASQPGTASPQGVAE